MPGRFDTVLVNEGNGGQVGVRGTCLCYVVRTIIYVKFADPLIGYRVGRLRLVFSLPKKSFHTLFPHIMPPGHLAYIEWFTAFTERDPVHGMYTVKRCRDIQGARLASVIEVSQIRRSCHLLPMFENAAPREWTSSTVLDKCETFLVNPFSDQHMYMTLV